MHNPDVFDKPFEFIPERYLKDGQIDPSVPDAEAAAFGHGRRYALRAPDCVDRYLRDLILESVQGVISVTMHCFLWRRLFSRLILSLLRKTRRESLPQ